MDKRSKQFWWVLTLLALFGLFSAYLALNRIYQVDEAQNVFMARVTALGRQHHYYTNGSIFLLGPLSWIAGRAGTSEGMFLAARMLFLGVFWLNLALIPALAGFRIRSKAFLVTLLLVATLAPLLDYGFEIRHDNVLLTLLLLFWAVPRRFKGRPWVAFLLLGFLSGVMQFTAFKSFLYWLPLSVGVLTFPPLSMKASWPRRMVSWLGGLTAAALIARLLYGFDGSWSAYINGVRTAFDQSDGPIRFAPWETLIRLLDQTPLLMALGLAIFLRSARRVQTHGWKSLGWEGSGPEGILFFLATLALLANPTPYPYNLLHVVPFLFLWISKSLSDPGVEICGYPTVASRFQPLLVGILVFCHIIPFGRSAYRHLDWTNERQHLLMQLAESLTDPAHDRVFDAAGLIPTREGIGYQWFLHTLVMERFQNGTLVPLWKQFEANPPQVVLRNYRTNWMGQKEQRFLAEHYLPLADDILLLGSVLPTGGTFSCIHSGRYQVSLLNQDGITQTSGSLWIDGRPFRSGSILPLETGPQILQSKDQSRIQVVWIGPRLTNLPRIPNKDRRMLFVNWY